MKVNIYSIYDKAIAGYMRPFFAQADQQAIRMFSDEAIRADGDMFAHCEDYSLHRIGSFDDSKGEITPQEPKCLARGHEVVAAQQARKLEEKTDG